MLIELYTSSLLVAPIDTRGGFGQANTTDHTQAWMQCITEVTQSPICDKLLRCYQCNSKWKPQGCGAIFEQNSEEHLNAALCEGGIRRAWSVVGNLWAGGWGAHPNSGRGGGWQRLK